jgi:hypothetical protein
MSVVGGPERDASLDDLFSGDEPEGGGRRRSSWRAWLARRLVFTVVIAYLGHRVGLTLGTDIPVLLLGGLALALFTVRRMLTTIPPVPMPKTLRTVAPAPRFTNDIDGLAAATSRWDMRLDWIERDPQRFSARARPLMIEIIDERLRQRHGFTIASDPPRARTVLGEKLWQALNAPITRAPTPRELAAILDLMESV